MHVRKFDRQSCRNGGTVTIVPTEGETHCCYRIPLASELSGLRAVRLAVIDYYPFERSALLDAEQNSIGEPAVIICAIERPFNPSYARLIAVQREKRVTI